jgi:hypothetical protein
MTESLVLLTPLLVLLLVAMFGFLGCAGVWGLDPVVPGVPVLSATAGNARVNLSWRTSQPLGGFRLMKEPKAELSQCWRKSTATLSCMRIPT